MTLLIYYKKIKYKYYYELIKNLRLLKNLKSTYLILKIELSLIKSSINFNLKKDLNILNILYYFIFLYSWFIRRYLIKIIMVVR